MNYEMYGPWVVDEDDRPNMEWNRHIIDSIGHTVCFMAHSNKADLNGYDAARAGLVALAPTLYTALEAFSSAVWLDPRLPEDMREQLKALYHNQVLPALEKAKS